LLAGGIDDARAAGGSPASTSPMAGNGHNVSFDGRVFVVTQGPADPTGGWFAMVLRPENIRYLPGARLDLAQGAFTAPVQIQPWENGENALALCETNADATPYACDEAGNADPNGVYDCYDFWVLDSNAFPGQYNGLRRRPLKLWIAEPKTPNAHVFKHAWLGGYEPLTNGGGVALRGIEPTVTRDGKLVVWQGSPANDGGIDILMYATTASACSAGGWNGPFVISHMFADPAVAGVYPLGEKQLRAADGTPFADGQLVHGAYPWLFPAGDALTFTATIMPCMAPEVPGGCGARRNALSVIGYPTNWGLAHIDNGLNPSTTDQVRLFFSSPGSQTFPQLPLSGGTDVWPLFGSNTANAGDVVFDDGLDGEYAGVWHMNESVNVAGDLDVARTPDTSGHFNTGVVSGAQFPAANNGLFGKALVFDGVDDWVTVAHTDPLNPLAALSIELWVYPTAPVDCDANNNYRLLLGKGNIADGAYSIILEEGQVVQARVKVGGVQRSLVSTTPLTVGAWNHLGIGYDGATGTLTAWVDGEPAGEALGAPGNLDGSPHALTIGGPGGARPACPAGDGNFAGVIDEVRISRVLRDLSLAPVPGNAARFVSQDVPAQVEAGQPFVATFTFKNSGTTAWAPGLAHGLGAQAPQDNQTWGTGRVALGERFEPGEVVEIVAELVAPMELGSYDMQWQMVHDGVEWFGPTSTLVSVEVVPYVPDPEPGTGTDGDGGADGSGSDAGDGTGATGGVDGGLDPTAGGGGGSACACRSGARDRAMLLIGVVVMLTRRRRC
jgi:hypothetical protein